VDLARSTKTAACEIRDWIAEKKVISKRGRGFGTIICSRPLFFSTQDMRRLTQKKRKARDVSLHSDDFGFTVA
jgi:hypothetical protein